MLSSQLWPEEHLKQARYYTSFPLAPHLRLAKSISQFSPPFPCSWAGRSTCPNPFMLSLIAERLRYYLFLYLSLQPTDTAATFLPFNLHQPLLSAHWHLYRKTCFSTVSSSSLSIATTTSITSLCSIFVNFSSANIRLTTSSKHQSPLHFCSSASTVTISSRK